MLECPASIAEAIGDYKWERNVTGMSECSVFRLERAGANNVYLKIASASGSELEEEKLRLEWLGGKLPAPEVLRFERDGERDYLLISEIEGIPASGDCYKDQPERVIEQLADGLRMIHALPVSDCPFDSRLDKKIELARSRIERNLVDETDFDDERRGRTAADLFAELLATRPNQEDLVFTHGDYCLPNIIINNNSLSGFIDWSRAGIADRWQDIALLSRSVRFNFGERRQRFLFEALEIEPDWKRIEFYKLLDEFF